VSESRKTTLLRACFDMLKKQRESRYVISPFETTVYYDGADCDGYCLMEDIASELEFPSEPGEIYTTQAEIDSLIDLPEKGQK
jgi:hypothetical protein